MPVAMFVLFFEMKKAGIVEWTRSHTSSIATHMIGPAILIHVTIFAQHTLIIVVLTTDLVTKHWKKKHEICFVWKPVELNLSNSSQIILFL